MARHATEPQPYPSPSSTRSVSPHLAATSTAEVRRIAVVRTDALSGVGEEPRDVPYPDQSPLIKVTLALFVI
jgi:hypothetical protein